MWNSFWNSFWNSLWNSFLDLFRSDRRKECNAQFRRLYSRLLAQELLMTLPYIGMWVKNSRFHLLEISEQAAQLLYNRTSNQCVGLSDYEIARESGADHVDEKQFADICRASDLYLKDGKPCTFLELITDTQGKPHIWKTIKSRVLYRGELYYFGFALFLDVMEGSYEAARAQFERDLPLLEKINENLYRYK